MHNIIVLWYFNFGKTHDDYTIKYSISQMSVEIIFAIKIKYIFGFYASDNLTECIYDVNTDFL